MKSHLNVFVHENISGIISTLYHRGVLYARVKVRLQALREVMRAKPIDIVFSIRRYDAFLESCYSEYIRNYEFKTFAEFENRLDVDNISWLKVLDDISTAYTEARLRCYDFNLIKSSDGEKRIYELLIGRKLPLNLDVEVSSRPAISQSGVEVLEFLQRKGFDLSDPRLVEGLAKILPKSSHSPRFSGWVDQGLPARLHDKYYADMEVLTSRYSFLS